MPPVEQIRRVVTQFESHGADKAAADLNAIAAAQGNVARSGETMASVTDIATRRQISAAGAHDRLMRSLDGQYRAQREVEKGQRVLDTALRQGIITTEGYARSLDLLKAKYSAVDLTPTAANDATKLASHEVSNLAFQLNDMATMLASGASPFQIIASQGGQISQIMGDRGLKAAVAGVGDAFLSLLTPVNLALLGIVAVGMAGSAAYDSIWGSSEEASKALERHNQLQKQVEDQYGGMAQAAAEYARRSEQGLLADVTADARQQLEALRSLSREFSGKLGDYIDTGAGSGPFVVSSRYKAFADPINEFLASLERGEPQVDQFRESVAALMNASNDPAFKRAGEDLRSAASSAADAEGRWRAASGALDQMKQSADGAAMSVRDLVDQTMRWLGNDKIVAELEKVAELDRKLSAIGDPRERAVQRALSRFDGDGSADQIERIRKATEASYDANKAMEVQQKAQANAARDAQRAQRELERDADRVWSSTRTALEQYNDELAELKRLLDAGAISQDTFARAAAKASETLSEGRIAEQLAALEKSGQALDGLKLGTMQYFDGLGSTAQQAADLTMSTFQSMEDAFAAFASGSKVEFSDLVNSMIADLARYAAQQAMMGLTGLLGGTLTGGATAGAAASSAGTLGSMVGNVFVPTAGDPWAGLRFAGGGAITGPGSGTSDSIVARVSNGEFIVNAEATSRHRPVLEAINSGHLPAFADGGLVRSGRVGGSDLRRDARELASAVPRAAVAPVINVHQTFSSEVSGVQAEPGPMVPDGRGGYRQEIALKKMVLDVVKDGLASGHFDQQGKYRYGWRRVT